MGSAAVATGPMDFLLVSDAPQGRWVEKGQRVPDLEALHFERDLEPDLASVGGHQSAESGSRSGIKRRARLERRQMDVIPERETTRQSALYERLSSSCEGEGRDRMRAWACSMPASEGSSAPAG